MAAAIIFTTMILYVGESKGMDMFSEGQNILTKDKAYTRLWWGLSAE